MTENNNRRRPLRASSTPAAPAIKAAATQSIMIKLPNGNRLMPYMIAGITPKNKGVGVTNSNGDMIGFIPETDPALQAQVMDLLEACKNAGKKFVQPDWSFLDEDLDDAVEETGDE